MNQGQFIVSRIARAIVLGALLIVLMTPLFAPVAAQDAGPSGISAKRYIVIDAETGEVFAERNADQEAAMASLTKIFTTIEALERGSLDQRITTKDSDLYDWTATTMGFGSGETFTLRDLLYGMMLPSGNDAAHAIARALGYETGDDDEEAVQNFIDDMNQRIRDMGLTHTNLKNPHGWGVDGHYSTVRDLAAFTRYALQYPVFREVIGTAEYTTSNGGYYVVNTNKLLNTYSGIVGGKTGYDDDAGYCLIEVATRDGSTMISVTLDGEAPDIWYQDNAILLDYAFAAKAERLAAGKQISGEIVSFRDPDAAQILAHSRGGNSIGMALSGSPVPVDGVLPAEPMGTATVVEDQTTPNDDESVSSTSADSKITRNAPLIGLIGILSLAVAIFCIWKALQVSGGRTDLLFSRPRKRENQPPD